MIPCSHCRNAAVRIDGLRAPTVDPSTLAVWDDILHVEGWKQLDEDNWVCPDCFRRFLQ